MIALDTLDLKTWMGTSVKEVFETMLSMDLTPADAGSGLAGDGNRIVGSVGFAGEVMGNVNLHVTAEFAALAAANMLGMEPGEVDNDEEVHDVIGEISNMIGGSMKSSLCDAGYPCELSIPSITCGKDFSIESKGWAIREEAVFAFADHTVFVEMFVKLVR
ncbi:MAG: chemotaxis protein CheX [Desulfobacterales bacterium]